MLSSYCESIMCSRLNVLGKHYFFVVMCHLGFIIFVLPFPRIPEHWGLEYDKHRSHLGIEVSHSLYAYQCVLFVLIGIYGAKKLLWSGLRNVPLLEPEHFFWFKCDCSNKVNERMRTHIQKSWNWVGNFILMGICQHPRRSACFIPLSNRQIKPPDKTQVCSVFNNRILSSILKDKQEQCQQTRVWRSTEPHGSSTQKRQPIADTGDYTCYYVLFNWGVALLL